MDSKIKIELSPFNALEILSFLKEFINESTDNKPEYEAITKAVDEYKNQIIANASLDQIEDAFAEREVNILLNRLPDYHN